VIELSFRTEQLRAEARYQRSDASFVRRTPLKNTEGEELAAWRALIANLDKRIPELAAALAPTLTMRWERCDDLSRHVRVRARLTEHELSYEPRADGTIDGIVSTKTPSGGGKPLVYSMVAESRMEPPALAGKLEDILVGWLCQPPLFFLIAQGLLERLVPVDQRYGSDSSLGQHVRALRAALDPNGDAILYPADFDHARVAPLLELVRRHPRGVGTPLRQAATELQRDLLEAFSAEQTGQRNPYRGGLL
jgi:hypothetical protein